VVKIDVFLGPYDTLENYFKDLEGLLRAVLWRWRTFWKNAYKKP
jgi:hypothetical protein